MEELLKCLMCRARVKPCEPRTVDDIPSPELCERCLLSLPPSLVKATHDPFDYALALRDGTEILFSEALIMGQFVRLTLLHAERLFDHIMERGVDVRISDIMWCADAPDGS